MEGEQALKVDQCDDRSDIETKAELNQLSKENEPKKDFSQSRDTFSANTAHAKCNNEVNDAGSDIPVKENVIPHLESCNENKKAINPVEKTLIDMFERLVISFTFCVDIDTCR